MKVLQVLLLVESVEPFKIVQQTNRIFKGSFTTPNGQEFVMGWYEVKSPKGEMFWEFLFANVRNGEWLFDPTGNGEQYAVLQNCLRFCQAFKQQYNPKAVGCSFKLKSQQKLYFRLLKQIWPEFTFEQQPLDHEDYIIGSKR